MILYAYLCDNHKEVWLSFHSSTSKIFGSRTKHMHVNEHCAIYACSLVYSSICVINQLSMFIVYSSTRAETRFEPCVPIGWTWLWLVWSAWWSLIYYIESEVLQCLQTLQYVLHDSACTPIFIPSQCMNFLVFLIWVPTTTVCNVHPHCFTWFMILDAHKRSNEYIETTIYYI